MARVDEAIGVHHWQGQFFDSGRQVVISREVLTGTSTTCVDQAIKAGRDTTLTDAESAYWTAENQDWLIRTCDYELGGDRTLPERRDVIQWRDNHGKIRNYSVGVDGIEREYRFTDATETILRVHTTEIK